MGDMFRSLMRTSKVYIAFAVIGICFDLAAIALWAAIDPEYERSIAALDIAFGATLAWIWFVWKPEQSV